MTRGTLPPNQHPSGHTVPQRAPLCPAVVPNVPRQLSLVVPSSPPIGGNGGTGPHPTKHFTASTCRKCGAITITGTTYGTHARPTPPAATPPTDEPAF